MRPKPPPDYLAGYPVALAAQVQQLIAQDKLAGQLSRVAFDGRLHLKNALGMHTRISRTQGGNLKARREIRVASVFREMQPEFLRMIAVHELAHLKEQEHGKAFYQLCRHMAPDYAQLEFDLRAYLVYLDAGGAPLWAVTANK